MSTLPNFTGTGFFAGEAPDGLTTIAGTPTSAQVRVYWRDPADSQAPDVLVASTQSAADGTWQIAGLNPALRYVVRAQKSQFDDVTVVGAMPSRSDVIAYVDQLVPREDEFGDVDGLTGYVLLDSGLPPFTCEVIQPLPYGLSARIEGRKLLIEGVSSDNGLWESVVRVTASNGVWADVPVVVQIQVLTDPHWDKVVALLHFDGDLGDETGGVFSVHKGMATYTTGWVERAVVLNGRSSILGGDYALASASFTVELFFKLPGGPLPPGLNNYILTTSSPNYMGGLVISVRSNQGDGNTYLYGQVGIGSSGSGEVNITGMTPVADSEWHHAALVYDGTTLKSFLDGVMQGAKPANPTDSGARPVLLGEDYNNAYRFFTGYIDELRITKGVARYTENFTPTDRPFPNR